MDNPIIWPIWLLVGLVAWLAWMISVLAWSMTREGALLLRARPWYVRLAAYLALGFACVTQWPFGLCFIAYVEAWHWYERRRYGVALSDPRELW